MRRSKLGSKGSRGWTGGRRPERKAPALGYNDLKAHWQGAVAAYMRGGEPLRSDRTWVGLVFHEPDRHRDPDGVYCGALKIIMDAMVDAKLIFGDTHQYVAGFNASRCFFPGDLHYRGPGVEVRLESEPCGNVRLWFLPFRLPDLNELLSARELGVRRQLRKAVQR